MPGRGTAAGVMPVHRIDMATRDMGVIAGLMNERYAEHRARFWCDDPARVDAGVRTVTAGPLDAALVRLRGFRYQADISPPDAVLALVLLAGTGTMVFGPDQVGLTRGDVILDATDLQHTADMHDSVVAVVRLPRPVAAGLAEEHAGLPAAGLRFESVTPVSAAAGARWARTALFICRQLITSGVTEVSPLVADNMTRLAAATLLETFPNTTMTAAYVPGPGQVAPSAVRRAAAFMEAQAGRPVTVAEVAGAAGVSVRALQYAFRSHYGITPTGYLRRVRLERAHRQLQTADAAGGMTVAAAARRWGWANQAKFAAAYRAHYGVPPATRSAAEPAGPAARPGWRASRHLRIPRNRGAGRTGPWPAKTARRRARRQRLTAPALAAEPAEGDSWASSGPGMRRAGLPRQSATLKPGP